MYSVPFSFKFSLFSMRIMFNNLFKEIFIKQWWFIFWYFQVTTEWILSSALWFFFFNYLTLRWNSDRDHWHGHSSISPLAKLGPVTGRLCCSPSTPLESSHSFSLSLPAAMCIRKGEVVTSERTKRTSGFDVLAKRRLESTACPRIGTPGELLQLRRVA